jgi:hypothetical protein
MRRFDHDEIRQEFERNGTTMDLDLEFNPPISSTPLASRKLESSYPRWYLNNQQKLSLNPKAVPFIYQKPQQNVANKRSFAVNSQMQKKRTKPNKKSLQDVS